MGIYSSTLEASVYEVWHANAPRITSHGQVPPAMWVYGEMMCCTVYTICSLLTGLPSTFAHFQSHLTLSGRSELESILGIILNWLFFSAVASLLFNLTTTKRRSHFVDFLIFLIFIYHLTRSGGVTSQSFIIAPFALPSLSHTSL